jgi:hypothetical protein
VKALSLVSLTIALAFLVAGCSSSKDSAGAASQAGRKQPPQPNQQAFERFQQCLQDHGVTLPRGRPQDGQPGQRPTLDAKTKEAFRACRQYVPSRPQDGFGGQGTAAHPGRGERADVYAATRRYPSLTQSTTRRPYSSAACSHAK